MSAFADIGDVAPQQIWDGVLGRVVHAERITFGLIELEPGSLVPEHCHDNEQVGMILEGSLTFRVGDEERDLAPGASWRILANVPHEVRTGPNGAVLIEVFSPPRHDWNAIERQEPRPPRWP
jgi:quercetin dioxygenase-like cupin family protein